MAVFGPAGHGDRIARRILLPLLVLMVVVIVPLWIIHSPTQVDGDSMFPTLHNGDRVLVTRGYQTPRLGDVVALKAPRKPGGTPERQLKRVVALQGQRVEIESGRAVVDGLEEQFTESTLLADNDFSFAEVIVPEGHVYVLGDNRPVSLDSRFYGPVPLSAVRGRVSFVFAPITRFGRVDWPTPRH